jgi:hypothetical protein
MPVRKTKKAPSDLREELLKLRRDDKDEFVRLVSEMVELLVNPDFRETAALYSSWPVNVPAFRARPRREKKPRLKVFHEKTREEKCEYVLDDLLQVGSGVARNLRPAKTPDPENAMTSLAVDIANIMSGIRSHPVQIKDLRSAWAIEEGSDEMAQLQRWVTAVKKLPVADIKTNKQWVDLGFEFAQIRSGINLERCGFVKEWLEGQNKTSGANQSAGFLKKRFGQALRLILNHR